MEIFIVVAFVLIVYLWTQVSGLQKQIDELKRGVGHAQVLESVKAPSEAVTQPASVMPSYPQPSTQHVYEGGQSPQHSDFGQWLAEDWLVKLGALLILLGCGWFVTYAFAHQWIGPIGRIVLGLLFGVGVMVLGIWRIRTHVHQGSIFTVLGSTIVLLTIFAAREAYDFFTPLSALTVMFCSVFLVAFTSVQYKNQKLALASIVLAGVAPFLTAAPEPNAMGLFLYVLLIVLGTLWVVYYTGWAELTLAALGLVVVYSFPFLIGSYSPDRDTVFLFALIFTALFFVTNMVSILYQKIDSARGVHLAVACGTVLNIMLWIAAAGAPEFKAFLYLAWMMVFALGSFAIYTRTKIRAPFYLYGGASVALLAAATGEVFEGATLVIAFTVEVAAIVIATLFLEDAEKKKTAVASPDAPLSTYASLLFAVPVLLSLPSASSSNWMYGVFHQDFFVLVIVMISFLLTSLCIASRPKPLNEVVKNTGIVLLLGSGVYALILIWLIFHALWNTDTGTMLSLFLYSVIGIALYVSGQVSGQALRRSVGGVVVGGVILRLLFVDVWQMALSGRIVTFLVIGALLMSTAFIKRKK